MARVTDREGALVLRLGAERRARSPTVPTCS